MKVVKRIPVAACKPRRHPMDLLEHLLIWFFWEGWLVLQVLFRRTTSTPSFWPLYKSYITIVDTSNIWAPDIADLELKLVKVVINLALALKIAPYPMESPDSLVQNCLLFLNFFFSQGPQPTCSTSKWGGEPVYFFLCLCHLFHSLF